MPERTCSVEGCTKAHRARGYCSTHYNQRQYPAQSRHRKHSMTCQVCGSTYESSRPTGRYCSDRCKGVGYTGRPPSPRARWARSSRVRAARLKLGVAALGKSGSTWVAGRCQQCGTHFVDRSLLARLCSSTCQRRSDSARRRARERDAEHDGYSRFAVFERDGWRCHLCGHQTDPDQAVPHPLAPTIDHVVPLARGGADTFDNVATACFRCNCTKGDRQWLRTVVGGNPL